jgi:ketosteroid isomerase-like protein
LTEHAGDHVTGDYFDPEIVWDRSASGLPSTGVYHGREGVRRFFRDWLAPWTDYSIEARECFDTGGGVVLVRQAGTGKASGVRAERDFFGVWELEGSKVVRFRLFASREQASDAAGLSE